MRTACVASVIGMAQLLVVTALVTASDVKVEGLVETGAGIKFPDDSIQTSAAGQYDGVLVVAKAGGQFTSIQSALDAITVSPGDRYLVYVAPGEFNERVTMKAGVDIQGSGALTTQITFGGSGGLEGTVIGANDAELRFLTVINTGGAGTNAVAIHNELASPRLTHVQAIVFANGASNTYAVYNKNSAPAMTYVFASATGGVATNYGVHNITTAGSPAASPAMRQVVIVVGTLFALGGDSYYGVFNDAGSSPFIHDSQISCLGGSSCYGIYSSVASVPILRNVTITASDAKNVNVGVYSETNSDTVMQNCRVQGLKGLLGQSSSAYGISNNQARPEVHHSVLVGKTNPIHGADPKVAYSQLVGPLATFTAGSCLGVYDENFTALGSDCD